MKTRSEILRLAVFCVAFTGAACAGGSGAGPDAGADGGTDTETESLADCSFEITPEGGDQDVCGLRISTPPGAVAETTTIDVTHPATVALPPAGLEQGSAVFSLQAAPSDFSFLAYVVVHFPQETGSSAVWVAKLFPEYGAWGVLETCFADPEWGGVRTSSLGTFTVLTDVAGNDEPGSGSADVTWGAQTVTFPFEGLGFANYQPLASGDRSVDLYGVTEAYETFRLSFALAPSGDLDGALVTLSAGDASWINWDGVTPPSELSLSVSEPEENHLVGDLSGSLFRFVDPDWEEIALNATFDAQVTRHFWGSDDPCYIP